MIANYHTHTSRCRHAWGAETEYIDNAIARGLNIFGFSDHTPQWFQGSYYSHMRMYPDQLDEYCNTIRALQAQYADKISIPLGLEVEYYPAIFSELMLRLQDKGIEYLILGQHWIGNEMNEPYSGTATGDEKILQRYCDQAIAAMETGLFSCLAHPDLIHFVGDRKIYEQHMRRLCKASIDTDTPVEINFYGIGQNRHYPTGLFWELAAEEGCKVVLGMDAHCPENVSDPKQEITAMEMVHHYDLNLLETIPLRKV